MDLDDQVIPFAYAPAAGSMFSLWKVANQEASMQPAFLWDVTSGARSLLMLPKITDKVSHQRLKKEFYFQADAPKRLVDHWHIFKAIYQRSNAEWNSNLLYFSKKWFDKLDDPAWGKFKQYLLETSWKSSEYWRNKSFFNLVFAMLQKNHQLNYSPYINDTVKHLFGIGMGCIHGLSPAIDNTSAPIDTLVQAYKDIYRLKNYGITIMKPSLLSPNNSSVFYSLNYPIAIEFSPKNRRRSRALDELVQIKSLINQYAGAILAEPLNISTSLLHQAASHSQFDFYHGSNYLHEIFSPTKLIENSSYFNAIGKEAFPYSSIFFQGCIHISKKQ